MILPNAKDSLMESDICNARQDIKWRKWSFLEFLKALVVALRTLLMFQYLLWYQVIAIASLSIYAPSTLKNPLLKTVNYQTHRRRSFRLSSASNLQFSNIQLSIPNSICCQLRAVSGTKSIHQFCLIAKGDESLELRGVYIGFS